MKVLDLQFFAEGDPAPVNNGEKTFTQDDVNRIISERLSKEKGKIDAEREASYTKKEQELNTRELKLKARETLAEKNLPSELVEVLNYTDEQSMLSAIDLLEKHINTQTQKPTQPRTVTHYSPASGSVTIPDPIRKAMGLN